jgi:ferredoxin/flavodoxin---NADP+ reductase
MLDLLIIGGGPAGLYASHLASNSGLSFTLVEASFELGGKLRLYEDKPIYDYPGFHDTLGKTILNQMVQQMDDPKIKDHIQLMTTIEKIETTPFGFVSYTNHHETIESKFILITHGGGMFVPRPLNIKDEDTLKNLHYHVKDASLYEGKKLVMFGGGDTATDWAHYFIKHDASVYLIHRRDDFRGDETLLSEIKAQAQVYTPYKFSDAKINDQQVMSVTITHLKTKEEIEIPCDDVFVFFGTIPVKTHPLHDDLLMDNNRLVVSTSMETSIKGIYASGNGVTYPGKQSMIITSLGEVATAMGKIVYELYPDKIPSYKRL